MNIEIGISSEDRDNIHGLLFKVLSNYYILLIKTQNYHWNVQGPHFLSYHEMLEDQYKDLFEAIDLVAERIRKLGFLVVASAEKFRENAEIKEERLNPSANEMLGFLLQDHEYIICLLREGIKQIQDLGDEGTVDMLTGQIRDHEKTAWILRSHL